MQSLGRDTLVDARYRIVKRLGSGGMADVYCAEDQQLGRRVALKILHRRFAEDEQFVERFRREASSAAGLSHPNIVAIFDRGEWDGTYYIAMEFVDGRTLKEIIREKGPAPAEAAADVTLQILRAARYAHRHGVVHRDIKPQNVLIDQDGRVRVADFGIARAGASDMTETGSIMGTAQYLSPEQAQGRPVDARADLYATGIVFYELLTGRVPFDADSPVSIALKQVSEPPIPPSELVPSIPPAIEAVVLRAMEKAPEQRFQTADEFILALENARAAPQEIPPPPVVVEEVYAEEEEPGRRWWLWLLVLLALAAIILGAYLLLRPEQLTVPDVIGREQDTASQILQNRGFEVDIVPVVDANVERGRVAAQDPRPNTTAPEGSTVVIRVSSGPGEVAVPAVAGMTTQEAEDALREAGLESRVEREYSDEVQRGRVIESSPAEGTTIERGSTVTLTVSRGREQVEVPDLVGQTEENARSALEAAGLRVGEVTDEPSAEESNTVLDQSPAAGERVDADSPVDITVARPTPVPDVVDMTEEEAVAELEDAGFEVRVQDRETTVPEEDGIVLEQNPLDGTERRQGSRVTIVVGRLATEPTPTPTPTETPIP